MVPTPQNPPGEPRPQPQFDAATDRGPAPSVLDNPRIGRINPGLSAKVHKLVSEFPERSVQVVRDWMMEVGTFSARH